MQVYLSLIETYLKPPSLDEIGIKHMLTAEPVKDITTAMTILATYHEKIDTAAVRGRERFHTYSFIYMHRM